MTAQPVPTPGSIIRRARQRQELTLAQLGQRTGYSAAQVSRYERGVTPLTDVTVLRRFATALSIPPAFLGLAAARRDELVGGYCRPAGWLWSTVAGGPAGEDGDVQRRQLLAGLALTAASAVSPAPTGQGEGPTAADLLVGRTRDAMLGLVPQPSGLVSARVVRDGLALALADFGQCRYRRLADTLPRLVTAGHVLAAEDTAETSGLLAGVYVLVTRMLIKLDDTQLGWMAADRAKVLAAGAGDPLLAGETARNLAVLARKAGWHEQAMTLALAAAADPLLRGSDPRLSAERGLLFQSAAYTAARHGDRRLMRELTGRAAALAEPFDGTVILRDHGGGFTPATVALHLISAENHAGDPGAAIAAAEALPPAALPTTERRARYWTETARACAAAGRRGPAVQALLAAEREAPEETHARPAIRSLLSELLLVGRTSPELAGLARRCGLT